MDILGPLDRILRSLISLEGSLKLVLGASGIHSMAAWHCVCTIVHGATLS